MADLNAVIETMENRWMRAWVNRDPKALKAITAKDFILLTGSTPPALLDRPSWLEAIVKRWDCSSYRFVDVYVRPFGPIALFAARLELKATVDGADFSGTVWVTDLWRKGRVRRGSWKLVQRVMSKPDSEPQLAKAVKSLQLWKA